MTIKGITGDSSGIKAISADAHTFPFNGSMPIKPTKTPSLIPQGNISKWSVPFAFKKPGVYRIVVTVRDNADNLAYAETTVNIVPLSETSNVGGGHINPRIAFVRYSFTEAAYRDNGFYDFYYKHGFAPAGKNITTDLDMLTVKTPRSVPEDVEENDLRLLSNISSLIPINCTELSNVSHNYFPVPQKFWLPFIDHVKKAAPNATVTVMRDEDVHDGHIFYGDNKTNAYDVLILFHNEYVTQAEYDNFRQFVQNGGTIVFIDPNIFFAEVRYDRVNDTITLIRHDWKFDGKSTRSGVQERWYNETKHWVGSNILIRDTQSDLTFTNNPFNYTHFEERFVNNPKDKILIDYGLKFPEDYVEAYSKNNYHRVDKKLEDMVVATYDLEYGKGKVIVFGLTGQLLAENQEFMKFFDNVILANALCPKFQSCYLS
jgi:hypothetical protein